MKKIVTGIVLLTVVACSTDWNFEDTGRARERFDGSMYAYLKSNSYDWDSVRLMIERAGLVEAFDGGETFTFFGPTNHSIRRWMNETGRAAVREIPAEECRERVMAYLLDGKLLRDDIPEGELLDAAWQGGKEYAFRSGRRVMLYRVLGSYEGIPKAGAAVIHLQAGGVTTTVASSNIQPANGVVHSLDYNHRFGTL
jgi:hypothetical protein